MTNATAKTLILFFRCFAITVVAVVVVWLVKQDVVLSGHFEVSHDYQSPSPFFTDLVPKQRVQLKEGGTLFTAEPVYTTLRYPRPFQRLDLTVEFENPDNLFVELGPQAGLPERYALYGLNHPMLNEVFLPQNDAWDQTEEMFHQRRIADYRYNSFDQFIKALPNVHQAAYYGIDWPVPFIPSFAENMPPVDLTTPLRGGHLFLLATNKESVSIELDLRDINFQAGEDGIEAILRDWQGNVLDSHEQPDDGEIRERGITSDPINISLSAGNFSAPAVLELELKTTDDIILTGLRMDAPYLVAKNHLHLAGGRAYTSEFGLDGLRAVSVQTSARGFTAMTDDRDTLQQLRTARETIPLEEPFQEHRFSLPSDRRFLLDQGYTVVVEKGNVRLAGRGVFALNADQYFSPYPWYADQTLDPDVIGIDYIVADYRPPMTQEDGSFVSTFSFDLADVFAPTRALRMQFSLPGLNDRKSFLLKHLSAVYTSESVTWSNAYEKYRRFIDREF